MSEGLKVRVMADPEAQHRITVVTLYGRIEPLLVLSKERCKYIKRGTLLRFQMFCMMSEWSLKERADGSSTYWEIMSSLFKKHIEEELGKKVIEITLNGIDMVDYL